MLTETRAHPSSLYIRCDTNNFNNTSILQLTFQQHQMGIAFFRGCYPIQSSHLETHNLPSTGDNQSRNGMKNEETNVSIRMQISQDRRDSTQEYFIAHPNQSLKERQRNISTTWNCAKIEHCIHSVFLTIIIIWTYVISNVFHVSYNKMKAIVNHLISYNGF